MWHLLTFSDVSTDIIIQPEARNGRFRHLRSTCADGFCPAGTEEKDGRCYPCDEGSASDAGGPCKKCPFGKYSEAGNSSCLECPPGTISDSEGASECDMCLPGKYEVNRQSCAPCPVGRSSTIGNSSCTKCLPGTLAVSEGSVSCDFCPQGKYSEEGSDRCDPCPPGTVSGRASGHCSQCDAGFVPKDSSTCELCPAGTFAPKGSSRCQKCSRGTYSSKGSESCTACRPGTISDSEGASECKICPSGRGEFQLQICQPCPLGTIPLAGNGSCLACPAGRKAPEQGGAQCDVCPKGKYSEKGSLKCALCPPGKVSDAASGNCTQCSAGRSSKVSTCELCRAGEYALPGSFSCSSCPSNSVSKPGSSECESCESKIIRSTPDSTKQSCQPESMDLILALVSVIASSGFCFLCLLGLHGRVALADISAQGQEFVITTVNSHFLMKSSCPEVAFSDTRVPHLDGSSWKVNALSSYQVTLHGKSEIPLDTSMGHFTMKFPRTFLQIGLWRCPLLAWCLLFGAGTAATMIQLEWSLRLLVGGLGILLGLLAFVWRQRWGGAVSFRVGHPTPHSFQFGIETYQQHGKCAQGKAGLAALCPSAIDNFCVIAKCN